MPDLSLVWALLLGVVVSLTFWKLRRRRPSEPRCAECNLDMEHETTAIDTEGLGRRLLIWPTPSLPPMAIYRCPRCGRRARIRY